MEHLNQLSTAAKAGLKHLASEMSFDNATVEDDPDDAEHLEGLTQRVLDTTMEPGTVIFEFSKKDLEQGIAALDVIDPDDFELVEMADNLNEILHVFYDDMNAATPEI